jgi:anti-sigma factor RsiW
MTCDGVRELIHPLLDEELDAGRKSDVEFHLQSCIACAEEHHKLAELRRSIRGEAPYYQAPERLVARVRSALRAEERKAAPWTPWTWISIAASLAFAAALVWGIVLLRPRDDRRVVDIVSSHVRSLMPGHLMDVPSSDQHTVKPWFSGKIDFSPRVKDLSAEGFPLVGGRLDYVNQRTAAVLVFHRRQHVINLYVWPSTETARFFAQSGFNVVVWPDAGLAYWAVSDVTAGDLREFERLYREGN